MRMNQLFEEQFRSSKDFKTRQIMRMASMQDFNQEEIQVAREFIDINPNDMVDEKGRTRRWIF